MRETKFRGRRIDNGVWAYGLLYYSIDHSWKIVEYMEVAPTMQDPCGDCINIFHDIDLNTVGQYTGLKDKNGKEIYEGDVVSWWDNDGEKRINIVGWSFDGAWKLFDSWYLFECPISTMKVIGNIYDNPELLE